MQLKYKFDSLNGIDNKSNESNIINKTLVKNAERRFFKDLKLYSEGKKEFDHVIRRLDDLDKERAALKSKKDYRGVIDTWDTLDEEVKREFISIWNIKVLVSKETAEVNFSGN